MDAEIIALTLIMSTYFSNTTYQVGSFKTPERFRAITFVAGRFFSRFFTVDTLGIFETKSNHMTKPQCHLDHLL